MRKRLIGLTLVGTLVVATLGLAAGAAGTFTDDDGNVHEGYIEALAASGITKGCSPTEYCPSQHVTRGQMAAFLNRALGLPNGDLGFTDTEGHVFESDIAALASAGITKGCNPPDNTEFCPDDPVTRGQMAAFLVRAFGYERVEEDAFTDDDGSVFEVDIQSLAAVGITKGCNPPDNTEFCPRDPVTRDQMASFLGRALGLTPTPPSTTTTTAPPFTTTTTIPATTTTTTTTTISTGFESFTVSGSGSDVVSLSVPGDDPAIIHLTHDGSSNFIVWSLEADLSYVDLLVNEIGPYDGVRGLNIGWFSPEPVRYLEIDADGNWELTVSPISSARSMGGSRSGHGDEVLRYTAGTPNTMHSTHDGSSNFIILGHESDGSYGDLIVNEIGSYNGTDVVEAGIRILEIRADGNWTLVSP